MVTIIALGPASMPVPLLLIGAIVFLFFSFKVLWGQRPAFIFLYLALSVRYISNFFHQYMAKSLVAGQSLNALVTLATVGFGLLLAYRQLLRFKALIVIYMFIAALLVSGVLNNEMIGTINAVLRQLLLVGVVVALIKCLDGELNDGSFVNAMLTIFAAPLVLQLVSIVFNQAKASEADGSISYIGGYIHESVFSICMLTAMALTVMSNGIGWRKRTLFVLLFFTSLVLANYRTAVLASLPMVFGHLVFGTAASFNKVNASYVKVGASIVAGLAAVILIATLGDRMADIGIALSNVGGLIKPPSEFAAADRDLFSGRLFIWSSYVYATVRSSFTHLMIGFGPDSWVKAFDLYAHNVFVSYLYELGVLGVSVYMFVFSYFFAMAISTPHHRRWAVVCAHTSFLILCLGTMPTFAIEGVYLFGTIWGYTLYHRLSLNQKTAFLIPSNNIVGRFRFKGKRGQQFA